MRVHLLEQHVLCCGRICVPHRVDRRSVDLHLEDRLRTVGSPSRPGIDRARWCWFRRVGARATEMERGGHGTRGSANAGLEATAPRTTSILCSLPSSTSLSGASRAIGLPSSRIDLTPLETPSG